MIKAMSQQTDLTERTRVKAYFAGPSSSWQRGLNEYTNGGFLLGSRLNRARRQCLPVSALAAFLAPLGVAAAGLDQTDGLRVTLASGEILHLRPSGNAPELRCYAEAEDQGRANDLVRLGLERVASWRG